MKRILISLFCLFFLFALLQPRVASAKARDGVMIATGVISVSLIVAIAWSALSGKEEKKKKPAAKDADAIPPVSFFNNAAPTIDYAQFDLHLDDANARYCFARMEGRSR